MKIIQIALANNLYVETFVTLNASGAKYERRRRCTVQVSVKGACSGLCGSVILGYSELVQRQLARKVQPPGLSDTSWISAFYQVLLNDKDIGLCAKEHVEFLLCWWSSKTGKDASLQGVHSRSTCRHSGTARDVPGLHLLLIRQSCNEKKVPSCLLDASTLYQLEPAGPAEPAERTK